MGKLRNDLVLVKFDLPILLSLCFMFYNFARIHQTLRVTPSIQAGIANHVWSIEEIISLLDSPM